MEVCSAVLSVAMVTEDGISQGNSVYIHTEKISLSKLDSFFFFLQEAINQAGNEKQNDSRLFCVGVEWHVL